MNSYISWLNDPGYEGYLNSNDILYYCLKNARNKITPIVDDIIMCTLNRLHEGDDRIIGEHVLIPQHYENMVWAFQLMKEITYDTNYGKYNLPNTNLIVQNVSVHKMSTGGEPVVIDEKTVVELLQVYERMGAIIQKIVTESAKAHDSSGRTEPSRYTSSEKSVLKDRSMSKHYLESDKSDGVHDDSNYTDETDKNLPETKSTLSALLSTSEHKTDSRRDSSGHIKRDITETEISGTSEQKTDNSKGSSDQRDNNRRISISETPSIREVTGKEDDEDGTIFIRIQCFSDYSDYEPGERDTISCAKNCPSHYHVKLNGEPLTLRMNQTNIGDGRVFCINTGSDDENDIRIVIKQCPECRSTVIGSSTQLSGENLGESHESITLHGKGGDETNMSFSSSDEDASKHKPQDEPTHHTIDVVIDSDNIDQSQIQVRDHPLTRRKLCSSMEFDVTKAETRLRHQEIEHKNAHVVVELNKLGVDQILRACRPAKCCRKAILNEKQKTALPYCVSLRSLPLMAHDIDVIKQSIDMSVKKNKNSLDLTEAHKDKLAYYVNLGRDDFRPGSNLQWVAPVYEIKHSFGIPSTSKDDNGNFFVLKTTMGVPKQLGSVTRLINLIKDKDIAENSMTVNNVKCITKKYFLLKKPICKLQATSEELMACESKQEIRKQKRGRKKRRNENTINSQNQCYSNFFNCKRTQSMHKMKNVWNNIDRENWRLIIAEKNRNQSLRCLDFCFGKTKIGYFSEATSKDLLHGKELSQKTNSVDLKLINNSDECGDQPMSSLSIIMDDFCQQWKKIDKPKKRNSEKKISVDKSISGPKFPPSWLGNVLEKNNHKRHQSKITLRPDKSVSCCELVPNLSKRTASKRTKQPPETEATYKPLSTQKSLNRKRPRKIILCLDRTLSSPKLISNSSRYTSHKLLSASKMKFQYSKKVFQKTIRENYLSVPHKSEAPPLVKKKLEYYVELVDGDLYWSNTLPLSPPNYNTFYNYDNKRDKKQSSAVEEPRNIPDSDQPEEPIEEPIIAKKVTPEEARRVPTATKVVEPDSRRSTLSELNVEFLGLPKEENSPKKVAKRHLEKPQRPLPKLPPQYTSFPMGPENKDVSWAPHVVSEASLPRIQEETAQKEKLPPVQAEPVPEKESKKEAEPERKPKPKNEPKPEKEPKTVQIEEKKSCSQNPRCVKRDCKTCKSKECIKTKCGRSKDIRISIKRTKDKGVYVEEITPPPCTKEICELFKNKKMMANKGNKDGTSGKSKSGKCETFTISAKDNMEIYINDDKVYVVNKNKKVDKSDKSVDAEKKKDTN